MLKKFKNCTENDQEWIINDLFSGKGVVTYEMITTFDSLNILPVKGEFFSHNFHSGLKDEIIPCEDYNNINKFWEIMNFENLGELNKIYNCQDTIILCEIFEQLSDQLQKLFIYNPRKCTSASYFSGCAQRHQSKCCIALPTDTEYVKIF